MLSLAAGEGQHTSHAQTLERLTVPVDAGAIAAQHRFGQPSNPGGTHVAKLRHIGITVPDLEAAANFYEKTFGMKRTRTSEIAILLSDGVVSLALLKFKSDEQAGDERGKDFHGLHHMGFVVEDIDESSRRIEENGGRYHMRLPNSPEGATEIKFRDPNGVVFDIVTHDYATRSWGAKP